MVNMKNACIFLALKTLREIHLEDLGVHEIIILKGPGTSRVRIWLTGRLLAYQGCYTMNLLIFIFINKTGIIKSGK
jgi:hypothetical protein